MWNNNIPQSIFLILIINIKIIFCKFPLFEFIPPIGKISVFTGSNKTELVENIQEQPMLYNILDSSINIEGYVYRSIPYSACQFIFPPPPIYNPDDENETINWILLASAKLGCDYETKIKNANEAGFIGVIIHNVDSNTTEIIPNTGNIPAYFVGEYDGTLIGNEYAYPNYNYITIERANLFWGKFIAYGVWSLAGVAIIGLTGTCLIYLVCRPLKCSVRWGRSCGICREWLLRGNGNSLFAKLLILPCSHKFHAFCMMPYTNPTGMCCPTCLKTFDFDRQASSSYFDEPGQSNTGSSGESSDPGRCMISPTPSISQPLQIDRTRVVVHDSSSSGSGLFSSGSENHGLRFNVDLERKPLLPPKLTENNPHNN